jgi:uncharacterized membrane protein
MGKNASAYLIILCFLLSLSVVSAQEDFSASAQASYTLCPCSGQGFYVTISNTGTTSSTYTFSASGSSEEWASFSPPSLSLNAKQSGRVGVFVNSPCNQRQAAPIIVAISTKNGLSKGIGATIQFNPSCYGFSLTQGEMADSASAPSIVFKQHDGGYSLCAKDTKAVPILVKNLDTAMDNSYTFSASGPARLMVSQFGLAKGASAVLMVEVSPETAGRSEVILRATSAKGQLSAEKRLAIEARDCYAIDAAITEESVEMCAGDPKQVAVRVSNSGSFRENISLTIQGAEWAKSDVDSLSLGANRFSSRSIYLTPPPDTDGEFLIIYTAGLQKQQATSQDSFTARVEKASSCYSSGIFVRGRSISGEEYVPITIKNTGSQRQEFSVWIENIDWGSLSENSIALNGGEERHLTLRLSPHANVTKGTYHVAIGIASPNQNFREEISVRYAPEAAQSRAIKSFFSEYRYYLIALIVLLILLIIFRKPIIRTCTQAWRKAKQRRERKEAVREAMREREAKIANQAKKSKEEETATWTARHWVSAAVVALALLFGILFAIFPAGAKAFFTSYGPIIAGVLALALIISLVLKKHIRKMLSKKK